MMDKLEYLDALRRAMAGLPPQLIAETLAFHEQGFVDGAAAGRSEQQIAASLDEPRKIAVKLRATAHMDAFGKKKNPVNLLRLMVSLLGLLVFNLFMVVPAIVSAALLAALYASALAFYLCGIAITASGLSGANELVLDGPLRHLIVSDDDSEHARPRQTRISIGDHGIHITQEAAPEASADEGPPGAARPGPARAEPSSSWRLMQGAAGLAGSGVFLSSDFDSDSRSTQTLFGIGIVLGGILLFLIGLTITHYALIGIKRYAQMHLAVLKGH